MFSINIVSDRNVTNHLHNFTMQQLNSLEKTYQTYNSSSEQNNLNLVGIRQHFRTISAVLSATTITTTRR